MVSLRRQFRDCIPDIGEQFVYRRTIEYFCHDYRQTQRVMPPIQSIPALSLDSAENGGKKKLQKSEHIWLKDTVAYIETLLHTLKRIL